MYSIANIASLFIKRASAECQRDFDTRETLRIHTVISNIQFS